MAINGAVQGVNRGGAEVQRAYVPGSGYLGACCTRLALLVRAAICVGTRRLLDSAESGAGGGSLWSLLLCRLGCCRLSRLP